MTNYALFYFTPVLFVGAEPFLKPFFYLNWLANEQTDQKFITGVIIKTSNTKKQSTVTTVNSVPTLGMPIVIVQYQIIAFYNKAFLTLVSDRLTDIYDKTKGITCLLRNYEIGSLCYFVLLKYKRRYNSGHVITSQIKNKMITSASALPSNMLDDNKYLLLIEFYGGHEDIRLLKLF